jgi:hypothetical protein
MLALEFTRVGNETHAHYGDSWYVNATDWAYFLFQNTTFMSFPWPYWISPQGATFFMDSGLITKHPREEYLLLLERVRVMVKLGYCGMFERRACVENASLIHNTTHARNFFVGELLERAWAPMFTGMVNWSWNLTMP